MCIKGAIQKVKNLFGKKQEVCAMNSAAADFMVPMYDWRNDWHYDWRNAYQAVEELKKLLQQYSSLEPWERKKLEIKNNERRRRKTPMVRSRAYIQAKKKRRKKKG